MKPILKLTLCVLFFTSIHFVSAEERILDFHSDIVIDSTGRIEVTEFIKVNAEGNEIKKGIFRQLPLYRTDKNGKNQDVNYEVLSIFRDGNEEDYHVENEDGKLKIYVGNRDQDVSHGIHEYIIVYESYGQVGFFEGFDELYWNVTGNDWIFPIDSCSASIALPNNLEPINYSCYTGSYGSSEKNCDITVENDMVYFYATTSLAPNEGFSVAASFPDGVIMRPPPPTTTEQFWIDYGVYVAGTLSLIFCLLFFYLTWKKVGRDPEKQTVMPLFKAPNNWSPALVRYVYKRGYDNTSLTVSIISMAVKKALKISYEKKKYTLTSIGNTGKLSPEESVVYEKLFEKENSITISDTQQKVLSKSVEAHTSSLSSQLKIKDYYTGNILLKILGVFLTICSIVSLSYWEGDGIYALIFPVGIIGVGISLFIRAASFKMIAKTLTIFIGIILTIIGIIVFFFVFETIAGLIFTTLLIGSLIVYLFLIPAYTKLGAKTKAELDGFKMYLKTAEKDRLNGLILPKQTPELFEELLPYAIALDVENEFGKNFDDVLKLANYEPDWYVSPTPFAVVALSNSFSQNFTSSVVSSSVDSSGSSSWSSGSSGGGFSGGGGGGGGGGGW